MAYARLRSFLGLPKKPIRVYDPVQQLAIVDEDVLERFHVDTIELGRAFALEDKYWAEWTLPDGTPCLMPAWVRPDRDRQLLFGGTARWPAQASSVILLIG